MRAMAPKNRGHHQTAHALDRCAQVLKSYYDNNLLLK
jgi:hypothetical protein